MNDWFLNETKFFRPGSIVKLQKKRRGKSNPETLCCEVHGEEAHIFAKQSYKPVPNIRFLRKYHQLLDLDRLTNRHERHVQMNMHGSPAGSFGTADQWPAMMHSQRKMQLLIKTCVFLFPLTTPMVMAWAEYWCPLPCAPAVSDVISLTADDLLSFSLPVSGN